MLVLLHSIVWPVKFFEAGNDGFLDRSDSTGYSYLQQKVSNLALGLLHVFNRRWDCSVGPTGIRNVVAS